MQYKKNILFFLFISFYLPQCKKYPEDGKTLHLETVKCRLAGGIIKGEKLWNNTERYDIIKNQGLGPIFLANDWAIGFARNGQMGGQMDPFHSSWNYKWEFLEKKNKIEITTDKGLILEYKILKLDNNSLWFQNDSLLYKFEPHKK